MPRSIQIPLLIFAGAMAGFFLRDVVPFHAGSAAVETKVPLEALPPRTKADSFPKGDSPSAGHVVTRDDVETLRQQLKEFGSLDERARKFGDIMKDWARSDPRAALAYALGMSDDTGYLKIQAIAAVAQVLATSDPQYLAGMAAGKPESASRQAMIMALANQWAGANVEAALVWAERLPDDRCKTDALALLHARLAREDPEAASRVVAQMPAGFARQNLIGTIATAWGLRSPEETVAWAKTLPEADQQVAIPLLAGSWAEKHPIEAGGFIADLPAGELQNRAAMSVVANWASQDPRAAAAWAADFPADGLRELGVREAVNTWSRVDAESALGWAKQLPNVETRDVALKSYAESIAYWAPDKTAAMVDLIQDPVGREQSMEIAMRSWSEIDHRAAEKWLGQLNIRDGLRNRLRTVLSSN